MTGRTLIRAGLLAAAAMVGMACTDPTSARLRQIEISPRDMTVLVNVTVQYEATVRSGDGEKVRVEPSRLTWTVRDTAVASISPAGLLAARRDGFTRVVVELHDGSTHLADSTTVDVARQLISAGSRGH